MAYNRRPHQARPSHTVNRPSYETVQTIEGSSYAESTPDYNYSLPPKAYQQPKRQKNKNNPAYFPGKNQDKEPVNIGGYQGAINPVFVSSSQEENRDIMSRVPTPPPRHYFPSRDYGTTKYWYDTPQSTRTPVRRTTERYDSSLYDYGYTKEPYNPPYETTRPTEDQQRYWQDYDLVTPPTYMDQDKLWEGYSNVVEELLQDREYDNQAGIRQTVEDTRYGNRNKYTGHRDQFIGDRNKYIVDTDQFTGNRNKYTGERNTNKGDSNKYIGDPQFVSTKPIIVGPGIAPGNLTPGQPSSDLLTSYSDRYGWTKTDPSTQGAPGRKWTSIELAKPVWDEKGGKERQGGDYQPGSVEQLDMEEVARLAEKETFGTWDQSLHLVPALARWVVVLL